ncbi:metallophosphoesterase [Deinococcus sp.]|uniref:metallophosphoesterase n=1 Tax=Deinococcus sp. TaxID=47478 RepID=UPI003B591884
MVRLRLPISAEVGVRLRVVQLSDLHGRTRFANGRLAERVNALKPDVVCVTGDLVSHLQELPRVLAELRRIACPRLYFVPGNWERETLTGLRKRLLTDEERLTLLAAVSDVARVLLNAGEIISVNGLRLLIYGFDNSLYGAERYAPPPGEADVRLLLAHSPQIMDIVRRENIPFDLLLTGHTHGGQIRFFGLTDPEAGRWHVGARREAGGTFYISRGLGTTRLPLRLGSTPEVLCADLVTLGSG